MNLLQQTKRRSNNIHHFYKRAQFIDLSMAKKILGPTLFQPITFKVFSFSFF